MRDLDQNLKAILDASIEDLYMTDEATTSVAASKLEYLRERGYRQCAIVMVGPGGCCSVSRTGHVEWLGDELQRAITGASMTEAERCGAPAVPPNT